MAPITGQKLGPEICKAFGIDADQVKTINVRIAVNESVTVTIERLVDADEGKRMVEVLDKFHLLPREQKSQPPSLDMGTSRCT